MRTFMMCAVATLCVAGPARAQEPAWVKTDRPSTYGAHVKGSTRDRQRFDGELIAVSADSIWLRVGSSINALAVTNVERIAIDHEKGGMSAGFKRMAIFGGITGVALMLACNSQDGSEGCIEVVPVSMLLSFTVGLLAAPSMDGIRWTSIRSPQADTLRAWARFPQGMPRTVSRDSLQRALRPPP